MKPKPRFKDVICIVCGVIVPGPTRTNNRQLTHKGKCHDTHAARLKRKAAASQYAKHGHTPLSECIRAERRLARKGHVVDMSQFKDPRKAADIILAGEKYLTNLARLRKNRAVKVETERVAGLPVSRSCIYDGPGPHNLLEYHTYLDHCNEWSASWILDRNSTHTVVCNLYDETGRNSVQFRPHSMKLQLSCDAFGLEPAGKSLVYDLNDPACVAAASEVFDLDSFLQYYNWIGCWVDESREEHNMKENQTMYEKSRWLWDAEKYEDVTPRLKNAAIKRRRNITCSGYRGDTCSGRPPCHLTLTRERLEEQSWKVRYSERRH